MSKIIQNTIAKQEVSTLPVAAFGGRIVTIQTEADTDKAVA